MELRHLRYFVAVAEELSFTNAAKRLGVGQSPLSQQVRALERELHVQLFERTTRTVTLSAAGDTLLGLARHMLMHADQVPTTVQQAARGEVGELRIGFTDTTGDIVLPQVFPRWRLVAPAVRIGLERLDVERGERALLRDNVDLSLVREAATSPALHSEWVTEEPVVVALPPDHLLARSLAPLPLADLAAEPFVLWSRSRATRMYDAVIATCSAAGFSPRVAHDGAQIADVTHLVAGGLGVALLPASVARAALHLGLMIRPLAPPAPTSGIAVAWRVDDPSPVLHAFLNVVRETPFPPPGPPCPPCPGGAR